MAVDGSMLYVLRNLLQVTADSASLAGASQLPDEDAVKDAAVDYAGKNMDTEKHGTVLTEDDVMLGNWNPDTRTFTPEADGGAPLNAVRTITRRAEANGNPAPLFLARVLGRQQADVVAGAIAWNGGGGGPCILALDTSSNPDRPPISVQSGTTLDASGCRLHANSCDDPAISVTSGSIINAGGVCACGETEVLSGSSVTPEPQEGCPAVTDPLATRPPPSYSGRDHTNFKVASGAPTLSPGVYCGGLQIENGISATLSPGVYIVIDGGFNVLDGSDIQGTGVGIYLTCQTQCNTDKVRVRIESNANVHLSAPTSGPMAGIIFRQHPNASPSDPTNARSEIASGSNTFLEGTLYFPTQEVDVHSNTTNTAPRTFLIAYRLTFRSNSVVGIHNGASSVPSPFAAMLALVK
jgi:hypothetical protein